MTEPNPFDLWLFSGDTMRLTYHGQEAASCMEFSRLELEDLKDAIASWEASYFYD